MFHWTARGFQIRSALVVAYREEMHGLHSYGLYSYGHRSALVVAYREEMHGHRIAFLCRGFVPAKPTGTSRHSPEMCGLWGYGCKPYSHLSTSRSASIAILLAAVEAS